MREPVDQICVENRTDAHPLVDETYTRRKVVPEFFRGISVSQRDLDAQQLLMEIAQCDVAQHQLSNPDIYRPCSKIVKVQSVASWDSFQIPEAWSGDIIHAPILFLSSNPSISEVEAYPRGSQEAAFLRSYFCDRFNGYWIKDGVCARSASTSNEAYGKPVRYWASIRNRAGELLARPAMPGKDYVLSEIVHCKSRSEEGVSEALHVCAGRFLGRLLKCSGAVVIILVGRKVLNYWNALHETQHNPDSQRLPLVPDWDGTCIQTIEGINRVVVYIGHPTGPEKKRLVDWLSSDKLHEIRSLLH